MARPIQIRPETVNRTIEAAATAQNEWTELSPRNVEYNQNDGQTPEYLEREMFRARCSDAVYISTEAELRAELVEYEYTFDCV